MCRKWIVSDVWANAITLMLKKKGYDTSFTAATSKNLNKGLGHDDFGYGDYTMSQESNNATGVFYMQRHKYNGRSKSEKFTGLVHHLQLMIIHSSKGEMSYCGYFVAECTLLQ